MCREDETGDENGRTCGDWDEISHMPSDRCEAEVNWPESYLLSWNTKEEVRI